MSFSPEQYPIQNSAAHLKLVEQHLKRGKIEEAFDLLTAPLHSALHTKQDFSWTDSLPEILRVGLYFDYVRMQVLQGGFLQLIANHYISLLLALPEWFEANGSPEMAQTLDDVLKVYVLNHEHLKNETTVEEFARLYEQFPEFTQLDSRFEAAYPEALAVVVNHLMNEMQGHKKGA